MLLKEKTNGVHSGDAALRQKNLIESNRGNKNKYYLLRAHFLDRGLHTYKISDSDSD